jgi:riboflavin kinase, archaea type
MRENIIRGKVEPGLGKGKYYISREGYRNQFLRNLGFVPFPGTLNIKLDRPFIPQTMKTIYIEGFWDENRNYGKCKCYTISVQGIKAAIIRPDRSNYPADLVEVIAPVHLREALGLVDKDTVAITLYE